MLKERVFLLLAIFCEVFGVSVMNYAGGENKILIYSVMFLMLGVSYYFMP